MLKNLHKTEHFHYSGGRYGDFLTAGKLARTKHLRVCRIGGVLRERNNEWNVDVIRSWWL
jgi:hypothetical protein